MALPIKKGKIFSGDRRTGAVWKGPTENIGSNAGRVRTTTSTTSTTTTTTTSTTTSTTSTTTSTTTTTTT